MLDLATVMGQKVSGSMNYGFAIDNRKCIGCHACTVACKSEHDIPIGVNRTHVKYVEKGVFPNTRRTFTVTRCNHCEDAPCTEICPTSALFTRSDGIVDFDSDRCIACKSCMQACPYDALYIDPETRTAAKCNYCAHRIESGYEPACVIVCPVEAIISGDLDQPDSKISRLIAREEVSVRKPEKGARPNVFYVEGDHAALDPGANDRLLSYLFSQQAEGVGHHAPSWERRLSQAGEDGFFSAVGGDKDEGLGETLSIADRAVDDVRREIERQRGRRVYDTPDKGILWGWQVPAYIWTKAVATGTFMMAVLAGWLGAPLNPRETIAGLAVSLIFLALTAALLIADLDRPERFLYVLLRPNWKSWLVRGAYVISAFGAVAALALLARARGRAEWAELLEVPGFALALLGAVYTAFLLAQAKGRDLWQSPISSLRMLNHALMAGAVVLTWLSPQVRQWTPSFLAGAIGLNLAIVALETLTPHSSADASRAVQLMKRGRCGLFLMGGTALGSALPLLIFLTPAPPTLAMTAGALVLAGIFLTEYAWVRAPQLIPLA